MSAAMAKATRLFRSLIWPNLLEEAQAIGKQGLVCMAAQEKFLRKEPPVHLVFEPEEGNEEEGEDQANFEPAVEGPIPQQEAHAHGEEVVYELQKQPHAEAWAQDPPLPVQGGEPSTEAEMSPNVVCTSYASPLPIQIPYGSPLGPFSNSPMFTQVWNVSHPISWPSDSILTRSWVLSLLNAFDWGSKYLAPSEFLLLLPIHVFGNLVSSASKILHTEPNCITIDGLGANLSVVVVGDIHEQLHDLIFLLQDAGRVCTTHGGLFRCVATATSKGSKRRKTHKAEANSLALGSLEDLSKARRAVFDPPWKGSNLVPGDVLWSNPSMSLGLSSNEERGIGLLWGSDCTEEFLKKSNLKLIIRSQEDPDARDKRPGLEGMDEGYTIDHVVESGKLITLFSAPDYPQFQATEERYKNKGTYIVLVPPHFDSPVFHSFESVTPRPEANPYYDYEDVIDSNEELDFESMG
ncbi:hypothetical protein Vadar_034083 [Vaccinium darrowii]|uniref:Uncharacterized protein n=1 Tax=Vaccinium darrowii TaxID=229202 RepID=A0ACB7ZND4_9ERIC|nr:hypothetical protein Vadar_034083 [Vaccinium darrowii]